MREQTDLDLHDPNDEEADHLSDDETFMGLIAGGMLTSEDLKLLFDSMKPVIINLTQNMRFEAIKPRHAHDTSMNQRRRLKDTHLTSYVHHERSKNHFGDIKLSLIGNKAYRFHFGNSALVLSQDMKQLVSDLKNDYSMYSGLEEMDTRLLGAKINKLEALQGKLNDNQSQDKQAESENQERDEIAEFFIEQRKRNRQGITEVPASISKKRERAAGAGEGSEDSDSFESVTEK